MPTDPSKANVLLDRITSPISGSFIFSWSLWNWKIFLFIFSSDLSTQLKINEILKLSNWKNGFLYPLSSSLIYLFVMPYLLYLFRSFTDHIKFINQLKDTRTQIRINNLTQFEVQSTNSLVLLLTKAQGEQYDQIKGLSNSVQNMINANQFPPIQGSLNSFKNELDGITLATEQTISLNREIHQLITTGKYANYGNKLSVLFEQLKDYLKKGK